MRLADIGINKNIKIFKACLYIVLVFCSILIAEEKEDVPALAILVYCDGGNQELADKLQPLLEAEAGLQWDGTLVERAKIDKLFDEMKLTRSGFSDPNTQLQFGKMIPMDCLLTVRVNKESVKTTFSQFPSTTIIHEKEYSERLEPQSLSVNIATNAIKTYHEHERQSGKHQVSIGSFFDTGSFKKYFDFSKNISVQLRQELVKDKSIVLTERLLPSDLLSEFELVRARITERIAKNLSAPPSDILLYGEFKAKPEQDLGRPTAELDFTLFLVSPTGLCESKKTEFSCFSNQPEVAAEKALKLIEQASNEIRSKIASGQKRVFSEKEFEEFKKQAFRLMQEPPLEDGDYYKQGHYREPIQSDTQEELERVFHLFECAMLFKGNDTQVLVCAGAILEALSRTHRKALSSNDDVKKDPLLNTCMDLVERAYFLESNWNTRGMYRRYCLYGGLISTEQMPSRTLNAARQIWNTRKIEPWWPSDVSAAFSMLFESESDLQKKYTMFLEIIPELEKDETYGLRRVFDQYQILIRPLYNANNDKQIIKSYLDIAKQLLNEPYPFIQATGHLLYLTIYFFIEQNDTNSFIPAKFVEHFQAALNMLPDLNKEYGKKFIESTYLYRLREYFDTYRKIIQKYGLQNDTAELMEKYVEYQIKVGNYQEAGLVELFHMLLPEIQKKQNYEKAYNLVNEFLNHYGTGGAADYDRMWLARERNHLLLTIQGKNPPLDLKYFERIDFENSDTGSINKVVASGNRIFGFYSNIYFQSGKAFYFSPDLKKAIFLKNISGDVLDIACSEKLVGIGTNKGFYLVDSFNLKTSHYESQNSNLPGNSVTLVCNYGDIFYAGIYDNKNSNTIIYSIEPDTQKIVGTDTMFVPHTYWRMKPNILRTEKSVVIPQNWYHRTIAVNDKEIEFKAQEWPVFKEVAVGSNDDQMLKYQGIELSYVFDFVLLKNWLLFATGNGLYISKPYSNKIHCIVNEPDLLFFSLCVLDHEIYMGTSKGLYRIGVEKFLEMVNNIEEK